MTFENTDTSKYYNNKYWKQHNFYSIDETKNVEWSNQSNSNTPEYNNDSFDLSNQTNSNTLEDNVDWGYQPNSNTLEENVEWCYQPNSNTLEENVEWGYQSNSNNREDNVEWAYQANSNSQKDNIEWSNQSNSNNPEHNIEWSNWYNNIYSNTDTNHLDWSYQSNSNIPEYTEQLNSNYPLYDINTSYGTNHIDWSYQPNSISSQLNNIETDEDYNTPHYSQKKLNKAKIFKKMRKENLLYKNYMESYELEIEEIRNNLSNKNTLIKNLEQQLLTMEKENNDLVSQNEKLTKKKDVYLNIINKWENWYDNLMDDN